MIALGLLRSGFARGDGLAYWPVKNDDHLDPADRSVRNPATFQPVRGVSYRCRTSPKR